MASMTRSKTRMKRMEIMRFPVEILQHIIRQLTLTPLRVEEFLHDEARQSQVALHNLCLTSRLLYGLTLPCLYEVVVLDHGKKEPPVERYDSVPLFLRAITENPGLRALAKHLSCLIDIEHPVYSMRARRGTPAAWKKLRRDVHPTLVEERWVEILSGIPVKQGLDLEVFRLNDLLAPERPLDVPGGAEVQSPRLSPADLSEVETDLGLVVGERLLCAILLLIPELETLHLRAPLMLVGCGYRTGYFDTLGARLWKAQESDTFRGRVLPKLRLLKLQGVAEPDDEKVQMRREACETLLNITNLKRETVERWVWSADRTRRINKWRQNGRGRFVIVGEDEQT